MLGTVVNLTAVKGHLCILYKLILNKRSNLLHPFMISGFSFASGNLAFESNRAHIVI